VGGATAVGITPVLIARGPHDHDSGPAPAGHGAPVIGDLYGLLELLDVERPAGASVS
jgi:hypothetical protein